MSENNHEKRCTANFCAGSMQVNELKKLYEESPFKNYITGTSEKVNSEYKD